MAPHTGTKVSVIVPVYNPGAHIDECVASILGQSMPPGELEAIFVDDGSTDGSGERLERLAAGHDHVTTIRIENSGWPGRPRNLGMDAARGEFVYFVDNDDRLGVEAMQRLHAVATRNGSDIVIGKVVGHRRGVPRELFRRNRDRATLESDPLLTLLTPHKLFRADFLRRHAIRFPEGRRRLEDHAFVVPAYLAAEVISIVADYPCYHWVRRDDGGNASSVPPDRGYWDNLEEVLDIVEARVRPGPERDRLLAHWYRSKMLRRLGGAQLLSYSDEYRRALVDDLRRIAEARFGPSVVQRIEGSLRVRDRLLRDDRPAELASLAEVERRIGCRAVLQEARTQEGGLALAVSATLVDDGGAPVRFPSAEGRISWPLPADVQAVRDVDGDVTAEVSRTRLQAFARHREDRSEYLLPVELQRLDLAEGEGGVSVEVTGVIRLDPNSAAAGAPLAPGIWDLWVTVVCCGLGTTTRVAGDRVARRLTVVVGDPPRTAVLYRTVAGNASVDLDPVARAADDPSSDPLTIRVKRALVRVPPVGAAVRARRRRRAA